MFYVLVCRERCMSAFSAFLLYSYYWQYFVQISAEWKLPVQLSIFGAGRRQLAGAWTYSDSSCRAIYKCNIFPTSRIEISLWKRLGHNEWCKSFSFRTVFELAHAGSSSYPKQVTWIACIKPLLREALTIICQDRVYLHHFYVFYHY